MHAELGTPSRPPSPSPTPPTPPLLKSSPKSLLLALCAVAMDDSDVPDTDELKVVNRNFGRRPMSDEDQRYTVKLMAKYGLDHEVGLQLRVLRCTYVRDVLTVPNRYLYVYTPIYIDMDIYIERDMYIFIFFQSTGGRPKMNLCRPLGSGADSIFFLLRRAG